LKKLLTLLLALGLGFTLAACGDDEEPEPVNEFPVIAGAADVTVIVGETFDELDGVTATDPEDGDLTSSIMVAGTVNTNAPGTYEVVYTVTDSAGADAMVTIEVTVGIEDNDNPELSGVVDEIFVPLGSEYDPSAGVTATDTEDGDITDQIAVGGLTAFDPEAEGVYTLTYYITDSAGITISATTVVTVEDTVPDILGNLDVVVRRSDDGLFEALSGLKAVDIQDGDLTSEIVVTGTFDESVIGEYTITLSVTDSYGHVVTLERTISVVDELYTYASGFYNFKFANTELRHDLMAAAETYLMNNMAGGVPLFASGSFNLYSSRLVLPVNEYVAVMGFGTAFGELSADDSTVLMDDGQYGNAGEYTYRTTIGTAPQVWNQWLYDTSTDSDLMGFYYDAPYTYVFNNDKSGYQVDPSMAATDPVAVMGTVLDSGTEVSTTWEVTLRDDLVWYFHQDTDADFLASLNPGDEDITATDFVDTFELALAENWFRAVSGGGDFCQSNTEIVGACDFSADELADPDSGDFSTVGLSVKDDGTDLTIVFEFVDEQSAWNVKYWLSSFVMTPINLELYDFYEANLTGEETNPYGTSNTTIAYHGAYYVDFYEADKVVRYLANPDFHTPDMYSYTGYNFSIIEDATTVFNEFVAGKLEVTGLPTAEVDNYLTHPGLKKVPGPTEYRMMINGLGTVTKQREEFPNSTWVPEPLLSNVDFKMAMFHAIDRKTLAEDILKVRTTNMYYFTDAYLVDAELGIPYRSTDQGISVGTGLFADTDGYNKDYAKALFKIAVADLIETGLIEAGTADNYNVITLELNNYANSESWDLACGYIQTTFGETFVDDTNFVQVQVEVYTKDFPAIYYDYMMIGEFDMSVGGISGSTLDAASFLDTYSSDNRSGFTINWGIDTSEADILVNYTGPDGAVSEIWAYDAIVSALNGEIFVQNGEEAVVPAPNNVVPVFGGVSFDVSEFSNAAFENFSYTIQYYDATLGYLDLPGFIEIPITSLDGHTVVDGLAPGFDDYPTMYQGDYQVVVNWDYVGLAKSGSTAAAADWWFAESSIAEVTDATTSTALDITLALNEAFTVDNTITGAVLLDSAYADTSIAVTVSGLQLTASGLTADTTYVVQVTYANGWMDYVVVTTPAS
jgi:ABC-type oligopeptide transport system substrate-binding subunit